MIPPSVYGAIGALERYPVLDTAIKEVVGINVPKIALTRTDTERKDVAISEIGNTMAFGVGGIAVDQLMKRVFATAQKQGASKTAKQWAVLARSAGVYSTVFSLMWAIPFIRNYVTAKQTGSVSFTDVIKATQHHKENKHDHQATLKEALQYYQGQAQTILGAGALGTVLATGIGLWGAKRQAGAKFLERLFESKAGKSLLLKDGKFAGFGGMPALLFWGLPAYGGWIHASRDPYEKKEQWLKFVNFVACFFGPSVVINKAFQGKFEHQFPQLKHIGYQYEDIVKNLSASPEKKAAALRLWAGKNLLSLGSSIILLGTIPQLINWYLTQYRLKRDQAAKTPMSQPVSPQPAQPLGMQGPNLNMQSMAGFNSLAGQTPFQSLQPIAAGVPAGAPQWPGWNPSAFSDTMSLPNLSLNPSLNPMQTGWQAGP